MTTELTAKPAELLNSVVFGEQHWQWNCKWSWKYCRTRRLIGSKSCTFLLSRLLFFCLFAIFFVFFFISPAIINTRTHPSSCKEMEVLLGSASLKSRCVFAYEFCQWKWNNNRQLTPSVFCAALSAGTYVFIFTFFKWLHFVYSGGSTSKLVPFDRPSYY